MERHEVESLARDLMYPHDLVQHGWTFAWGPKWKRTIARTEYRGKVIRYSLPDALADDRANVEQILLHEITHAIVGPREGHGPLWRAKARELGYRGGRLGTTALREAEREEALAARVETAASLGLEPLTGLARVGSTAWFIAKDDVHFGRIASVRGERCSVVVDERTRWSLPLSALLQETAI